MALSFMKRKSVAILALIGAFAVLMGYALWRELARDAEQIRSSVSGLLDVDPDLLAAGQGDIVRTDRAALILVDVATRQPVALKFESPLVPPMNFRIGQADSRDGTPLTGRYELIAISDKDGEVFRTVPGEVYGRADGTVSLGDRNVVVRLSQPFHGTLFNDVEGGAARAGTGDGVSSDMSTGPAAAPPSATGDGPPERTVRGVVRVAPALAGNIGDGDRLIVMLFDPAAGRPAAIRIVAPLKLPQAFSISIPPGQPLKAGYSLRILTDKDNNPFRAVPGEVVGRSSRLVTPGTRDLDFVLDQPYTR